MYIPKHLQILKVQKKGQKLEYLLYILQQKNGPNTKELLECLLILLLESLVSEGLSCNYFFFLYIDSNKSYERND